MSMRHLEYPDIPFHALLRQAADHWPDKTAIKFRGRALTFKEWNHQADAFATGLQALGVRPGDRVALYMPNHPDFEIAFFGCTRCGAVATPINPSFKEREVRYQLEDSGATLIIVHTSLSAAVQGIHNDRPDLRVVVAGNEPGIGDNAPTPRRSDNRIEGAQTFSDVLNMGTQGVADVELGPDDLAALPYSSGTTGLSKGVMLTQSNLVHNAYQFVDTTQSTDADVLLIFLPLYHIYGVSLMATAVASGAKQVLMERFELEAVLDSLQNDAITELYVVPPVMLALAGAPDLHPEQFAGLRFIMSAAAPLAADIARRVSERLQVRVIQAYGMTETSPLTHMVPLELPNDTCESVGTVAADTECRIVDLDSGQDLPIGEVGEVLISGPQVMAGYWNAPQESSAILHGGWISTGDIGRVDESGNLYIVDRKKEMIKHKAFSIAPAELEFLLLEHPAVADCAVTALPDDKAGEVPHAHVVVRSGAQVTPEELQTFVRERVAGYKQIRRIDIVDAIPRTPSGKILRRLLAKSEPAATTSEVRR
jgi:long-chain acyl-CoA synthetase